MDSCLRFLSNFRHFVHKRGFALLKGKQTLGAVANWSNPNQPSDCILHLKLVDIYPFSSNVLLFSRNIYFLLQSRDFLFMCLTKCKKDVKHNFMAFFIVLVTSLDVHLVLVAFFPALVDTRTFSCVCRKEINVFHALGDGWLQAVFFFRVLIGLLCQLRLFRLANSWLHRRSWEFRPFYTGPAELDEYLNG